MPSSSQPRSRALQQHSHLRDDADERLRWLDLENDHLRLRVMNLGAITAWLDLRDGETWQPMVLGYADMTAYLGDPYYLGAIVGRVANRIGGAGFHLAGREVSLNANEGSNQLHGGAQGLGRVFWDMRRLGAGAVELRHFSADGENGYPGGADIRLRIAVSGTTVSYDMTASVDQLTPISLAQHNYYTLGIKGDIWGHRLHSSAESYLPLRRDGVPTGEIAPTSGTRFDYRAGRSFAALDPERLGTDIHVNFPPNASGDMREVAQLGASNGVVMRVFSDQPGAQIYTASHLNSSCAARDGQGLAPFSAVCIEPQGLPDAVNQPHFPSVLVDPGHPYRQKLLLKFSVAEREQDG
ncbi:MULTISPECIES: aldose epimerase family protein [unclassified Phaeobacter]|uniref:aldose epimerase family protein n=1 Tax=unclassified Phaeobacter TaxID=2621772 RepID=UPI003A85B767